MHTHSVAGTHFILQNRVHNPTWSIGSGIVMLLQNILVDKVLACQTAKLPTHRTNSWRFLLMLNVPGVCPKFEPLIPTCLSQPNLHKNVNRVQVSRASLMTISRKVLGESRPPSSPRPPNKRRMNFGTVAWQCWAQ